MSTFDIESSQKVVIGNLGQDIQIKAVDKDGNLVPNYCGSPQISGVIGLQSVESGFKNGTLKLENVQIENVLTVADGSAVGRFEKGPTIAGWLSVAPALLAIVLAVVLRQAMLALFLGIWFGVSSLNGFNPWTGFLRAVDTHLVSAVAESGHAAILLFTMALGGMVGVLAKSGGTHALIESISGFATNRRRGMLTTWFAGLLLFFDDYANCLLVGNTIRPLTDKLKISREKLAYMVDSTAAPITTVAVISTWVGYQLGLLEDLAATSNTSAYELFISMLPYSFYSLFTIGFVFMIAWTGRDFGPMLKAERRAHGGQLLRPGASPMMDKELTELQPKDPSKSHWLLALIPIVGVVLFVSVGLYINGIGAAGEGAGLRDIIASADSYAVLMWAGFGGSLVAAIAAVAFRALTLEEVMDSWVQGVKAMLIACLILVLAWTLGDLCKTDLLTGDWVLSMFQPSPRLIPTMTFIVSAMIALATGSSFSAMAIVIPIAGPMAWALTGDASGIDATAGLAIRLSSLAAVLSGAVFGDHCSPISDTTIMSSMSSASDHLDHVKTQAPYAIVCGTIAILFGYIPVSYGINPWLCFGLGFVVLASVIRFAGRKI